MSYWDIPALAKLCVTEADSTRFEQHAAESTAPVVTAEITLLEMRRVVFGKEASGVLQSGTAATLEPIRADLPGWTWSARGSRCSSRLTAGPRPG